MEHFQTHHDVVKGGLGQEVNKDGRGNDPRTFSMACPAKAGPRPFPVKGCSGQAETHTAIRVHFWNWHVRDTVVILEEVNLPHPRFPLCDMPIMWRLLNGMHWRTTQCKKGGGQK